MFPGDAPGGVTCGDAMAPVGAGAVVEDVDCAQAIPVPTISAVAVEASQIARMFLLLKFR